MKIVVFDSFAMNPGDLDWDELMALGACTHYERTPPGEVIARSGDAEAVLTNKVVLDKDIMAALPKLRYIGITATGTNVVDIPAAKARGIIVTNVPAYSTASVAQMAIALLLELTNHAGHYDQAVHEGRWQKSQDFTFMDRPITALAGLTLGIVGFGHIGQEMAKLGQAFGMKLRVQTRTRRAPEGLAVEFCELDELFSRSDVVSLHCPLTAETTGLVSAARLKLMKPSAYLLNVSRGPLVDEGALAAALNEGRIAGAGLEVLSAEPPKEGNPLLKAKNCIITPHIAWASKDARKKLMSVSVENLRRFIAGQPVNVVNP